MWDGTNWHGTPGGLLAANPATPNVGNRGQAETMPVARHRSLACNSCEHIKAEGREVICLWLVSLIDDTRNPPCGGGDHRESFRWIPTLKKRVRIGNEVDDG